MIAGSGEAARIGEDCGIVKEVKRSMGGSNYHIGGE